MLFRSEPDPEVTRKQAFRRLAALVRDLSNVLAGAIGDALFDLYPVLDEIKRRLKSAIKPCLAAGIPVCWVTPSGMPVLQPYYQHEVFSTDLACLGRLKLGAGDVDDGGAGASSAQRQRLRMQIDSLTTKLLVNRHRRAILPNVVHSMDASHLVLAINSANALGVNSFCVIHDSFGTHACDAAKMRLAIDHAFTDLYGRPQASIDYLEWWFKLIAGLLGDVAEHAASQAWHRAGDADSAMRLALLNFARGQRNASPIDFKASAMSRAIEKAMPGAVSAPLPGPALPAPTWLFKVSQSPYFFA